MNTAQRHVALAIIMLAFAANGAFAAKEVKAASAVDAADASETDVDIDKDDAAASTTPVLSEFCFFSEVPPADKKYTVIKKLKLGKGTYGGVKDILPKFAAKARQLGADAIIEYSGGQRFGFWPWRAVRPVVRGVAVKWADPKGSDCKAIGGTTLQTILATDQAPPQ